MHLSDPDVSPNKCLEVLENAFGLAESGDDLYFAFRMQQQPGDKLSDFLKRFERCLSKVIERGGLSPRATDGAWLRERRTKPPTFLELLKEIHTEEEYEASRAKLNQSV